MDGWQNTQYEIHLHQNNDLVSSVHFITLSYFCRYYISCITYIEYILHSYISYLLNCESALFRKQFVWNRRREQTSSLLEHFLAPTVERRSMRRKLLFLASCHHSQKMFATLLVSSLKSSYYSSHPIYSRLVPALGLVFDTKCISSTGWFFK